MNELETQIARLWEITETQILQRERFYGNLLAFLEGSEFYTGEDVSLCTCTGPGDLYRLLLGKGDKVYGNDGSRAMLKILEKRMKTLQHWEKPTNLRWQDLPKHYPSSHFDFEWTEGNSLIYTNSWAQRHPDLSKARAEIEKSIAGIAAVLKKGGRWYVDLPKETEISGSHRIRLNAENREIDFMYSLLNDWDQKVRTFVMEESYPGYKLRVTQKAFLITGEELRKMCVPIHFSKIEKLEVGDPHYQGYLLTK